MSSDMFAEVADVFAALAVAALDEDAVDALYDQAEEGVHQYRTATPGTVADLDKMLMCAELRDALRRHAIAQWGTR